MRLVFEDFIAPAEAARMLNVSTERVRQLVQAGALHAIETPLGRIYRRADVDNLRARREQQHHAERPPAAIR